MTRTSRRLTEALLPASLIALLGLAAAGPAPAQTLSGATLFATDGSGANNAPLVWSTASGGGHYDLWFQPTGSNSFINGGASAPTLAVSLATPGTYDYALYGDGQGVPDLSDDGLNLFFDGAVTPAISVFGPTQTTTAPSPFAADGAYPTLDMNGNGVPGSGATSFTDGGNTVALTGFSWALPSVYSVDRVSGYSPSPNGVNDYVGTLTLTVTGPAASAGAVPESGPFALLGLGLPPLALLARKRRA